MEKRLFFAIVIVLAAQAILALAPASIVEKMGYKFGEWRFFGFFLFLLVAWPAAYLVSSTRKVVVHREAKKCRYCGAEFKLVMTDLKQPRSAGASLSPHA